MPYYEYQCTKCKKTFEYLQKISDTPKKKCEKCGSKLNKLISNTAFQLKGSGWYADGYSSSKKTTAETKPAPKAEAKPAAKKSDV
ncbi:MAG TPA: transcriptional regulator [Deltaproteobacteria bacterium]|nr:MAG: hypothetical protein A2048_09860 [Deltaproteobacteria bacterium GWA2_45_12]HBF12726.1 transcriptional regulator [Deltaproteobacteria bacterium]